MEFLKVLWLQYLYSSYFCNLHQFIINEAQCLIKFNSRTRRDWNLGEFGGIWFMPTLLTHFLHYTKKKSAATQTHVIHLWKLQSVHFSPPPPLSRVSAHVPWPRVQKAICVLHRKLCVKKKDRWRKMCWKKKLPTVSACYWSCKIFNIFHLISGNTTDLQSTGEAKVFSRVLSLTLQNLLYFTLWETGE